jgi:NAD(P)-dependent dehydrogenase (short-subunit alcohol dehydrogenase family)
MTAHPLSYAGRRVIVTGAASGIGAALAEILVGLGAEVHSFDLREAKVEGHQAAYGVDIGDPASIDEAVMAVGGPIDGLFNCAGVPGTADGLLVLRVNFCGLRHLTERVVPHMASGGAICSVGSTSAVSWARRQLARDLVATADFSAARAWCEAHVGETVYPYDFSKEAVNVYTAVRALSLNAAGVRMTCVNPGGTRTAATADFGQAVRDKAHGAEMLANYPRLMGRLARPDEQAWPMVFLNSPLASFITGASLNVDAGFTGGLLTGQFDPVVELGMRWEERVR